MRMPDPGGPARFKRRKSFWDLVPKPLDHIAAKEEPSTVESVVTMASNQTLFLGAIIRQCTDAIN